MPAGHLEMIVSRGRWSVGLRAGSSISSRTPSREPTHQLHYYSTFKVVLLGLRPLVSQEWTNGTEVLSPSNCFILIQVFGCIIKVSFASFCLLAQ